MPMRGSPLPRFEIEKLRQAGAGIPGDRGQEAIAKAALERFGLKEITVFDSSGQHEYFRLGARDRHRIVGVHVHMGYFKWDDANGVQSEWLRAGSSNVVGLVNDPRLIGNPGSYVDELLRALAEGRYSAGEGE
jgi:hypothetical protein